MNKLTVLYDANCAFCVSCRWWLANQPAFIELDFYPAGSPHAARRFSDLEVGGELTVIDEGGGIYRGPQAFLMCLYALEEYRELSLRLAHPMLMPLARKVFEVISNNRGRISKWLLFKTVDEAVEQCG